MYNWAKKEVKVALTESISGGRAMPTTKMSQKNGRPDPAILADIVKRIVDAAEPEKIVLFGLGGSAAIWDPIATMICW